MDQIPVNRTAWGWIRFVQAGQLWDGSDSCVLVKRSCKYGKEGWEGKYTCPKPVGKNECAGYHIPAIEAFLIGDGIIGAQFTAWQLAKLHAQMPTS
jgi:hypothetical protein